MDGISFILKRFLYSFLSGCIIIFYVIVYYNALKKVSAFSHYFEIVSFESINSYFVLIIVAILLSIIIEGICQIGLECYLPLYDKEKEYSGKRCRDFKTCKEKCEFWKYKIYIVI